MSEEEITHTYEPDGRTGFVLVVAREGIKTVDGREFTAGAIDWREPPISLMAIRTNDPTGRGGHKSSTAIGAITELWREDDENGFGTIYGRGHFASDEEGQSAHQLIKEGVLSGVSADVGGAIHEELTAEDDGSITPRILKGTILAVTVLPIPAFDGTKVSVTDEQIVASSGPAGWAPPSDWFEDPKLKEPTPITVTADGRIYGHAAVWGTCHVGYRDRCVTPPKSKSGYGYFNVGQVLTADGKTVNVGRLTAGTGHASIEFGAQPAVEHYDNTGWAAGYATAGEDAHGIWFAGAVSPAATDAQIATLRASSVSGDWRAIQNALELVGILAVNTPGFPMPRARAGLVAGAQISLIASGLCGCENDDVIVTEVVASGEPEEKIIVDETAIQPIVTETESEIVLDEDTTAQELAALDLAMLDVKMSKLKRKAKDGCCAGCK